MNEVASQVSGNRGDKRGGSSVVRRFLLQDAESLARRLSDPERRLLREQIARARQKVESAKVLWSSEQYVEGLRLAEEGIGESLRAVELAGAAWPEDGMVAPPGDVGAVGDPPVDPELDAGAQPRWERVLSRLGATPEELAQARAAQTGATSPRPQLNEEISPAHRRYCRTAVWIAETALGRVGRLASTPSRIVVSRFLRIGALVAGLVVLVVALSALRGRVSVRASAQFPDSRFAASHVNDGNPKTEWLLPSRVAGSVEIGFSKRDIAAIKVLNSANPPHNDRATKDFRVECLRGGQVVHTSKHAFPVVSATPEWMRIAAPCKGVDTVRVLVDSWHVNGGGLAEVAWE